MRKHRTTYIALLLSTFIIGQMSVYPASAAPAAANNAGAKVSAATAASTAPKNLGSIPLEAGVKATLEDVSIWSQSGGNILTYTLNYSNSGGSNANLSHYFSRVVTSGGSVIPGNPVTADAAKNKVVSNQTERVTYYVNVGKINSLKGLKVSVYVWDPKSKGYLRHAGAISLPANYSSSAVSGQRQNVTMNNIPVSAASESLQIYKYGGKVFAKVGINFSNEGNKVLTDPGYTAYLMSAGGTAFELALDNSMAGYKIQPLEKKTIYYVTEIPPYLKTDNMKVQYVQRDETLKFELPKFSSKLPAAVTPDLNVGKGAIKKIGINSNTIELQLTGANVYGEDASGVWTFQFRLKNAGKQAVVLPTYDLSVRTAKGTTFPISSNGVSGASLKPMEEKVIQLTAQIPLEVEQNTLKLQMIESVSGNSSGNTPSTPAQGTPGPSGSTPEGSGAGGAGGTGGSNSPGTIVSPSATAKLSIPVAYFAVPYTLRADTQKAMNYRITNQYGTFDYSLMSLQRFPWKNDDILIAKLNITNTQSVNLTLPDLKGALKLDNNDLSASTDLFMEKEASSIAPGKSAEVYVFSKIPYTTDFKSTRVNLYSVVKDENVPFLSLNTSSVTDAVYKVDRGGSYTIVGKGKNAKVQENKTVIYQGINSNIVYTEMFLSSEEKRQSKMARLQAYFKTADGQLYETTPVQPDMAATPGGKQLVTFWAKLPKSVDASDVTLYLGPGINGNKFTEAGQESTGFINVSALELSPQYITPVNNLSKVTLYPYTLSVLNSEGRNARGSDTINITMNYSLLRDISYDVGSFDHKLVLKMTDPYGQSQEKSLTLGTDLIEGDNNRYSMSFSSETYKKLAGGTYSIRLYDEFQGERIELANQAYTLKIERATTSE
ncbi:hypothetical protein AMQ84_28435 [Paenibacillus riograndensis]|uniref:Uncharacterized protein n=1 Tax=Paenibacillus riograndensis TaxID=483937 RepID=A0A132THY8_9BACL|nr:hypothetical protein [Paenibacillus riograndensis]KWX70959.1 hypothetical protein AMQ84_28435 [Paenibacillus riograndensis]